MASGDSVQKIKERLSIVDVIAPYVELKPAGKNFKGKSPFTNERTPSFYVSPDRGMYYCFSSSQGGDMFTFIQTMEGVDFKDALKLLAEQAGVELVREDPKKRTERERQYDVLEVATAFFQDCLPVSSGATTYVKKRGVSPESVVKWRIGYAPGPPTNGWREVKQHLEALHFTTEEIGYVGLIKGFDSGKEPYDVFRDRVMFPIFDAAGKVVGFSGRILTPDTESPKYVNSPETGLFNKSEVLYGYDKAKQGIRQYDFSLIVEGQFDVVMTHQIGYHNAVAVSGTALTAHHVMLLQRLSNKVVLALDADRAGIAAVQRAADLMLARGMDVKVARLPDGQDPADIITTDPITFKKCVGNATPVIEYLLEIIASEGKDERTFKLRVREQVLPYVAKIPNRIDQEYFIERIATRVVTTADAIRFEVERIREQQMSVREIVDTPTLRPISNDTSESIPIRDRKENVLAYLLTLKELLEPLEADAIKIVLHEMLGKDMVESFITDAAVTSKLTFELEAQLEKIPLRQRQDDTVSSLNQLRAMVLKEQLRDLRTSLKVAEETGDDNQKEVILQEIVMLQKKLAQPAYTTELFTTPEKID